MILFARNVKKIKGVIHRNRHIYGTCKRALGFSHSVTNSCSRETLSTDLIGWLSLRDSKANAKKAIEFNY